MFQIYQNLNWKKAETEFNIRFNNDQKDVWKPDAIPAIRHFSGKTITLTQIKSPFPFPFISIFSNKTGGKFNLVGIFCNMRVQL